MVAYRDKWKIYEACGKKLQQPTNKTNVKWALTSSAGGPGWNVTVFVPASASSFSDFPWDPTFRQVVSNVIVSYLSYHDDFAKDFPGTPANDFAIVATGNVAVSAGYHVFCTFSYDGSSLFVDGTRLFDNYGTYMHPTCGYIRLNEGIHTITVNYFKQHANRTGSRASLEVSMDGSLIIMNGKDPHIMLFDWIP